MKKVLTPLLLILFMLILSGCEREGTVEYSDCREQIPIKEWTLTSVIGTFTCDITKTDSDKIMGGKCIKVKLKDGKCTRAYFYDKQPEINCSDDYPYAGKDDKCYQNWDYGRVFVAK